MDATTRKILCTLAKDCWSVHTASTLALQLQMSRWGLWKALKKLEKEELIRLQSTGKGKTSTYTIHLNWKSTLAEKTVALALAQEAEIQKRWTFVFAEMEAEAEFVILFGSILPSPKTAADIDIITVAKQAKVLAISRLLEKIQQTQEKNIHAQNFTLQEFKKELHQKNKIFLDALHRGVILFGQEKFLQFIQNFALLFIKFSHGRGRYPETAYSSETCSR